MSPGRTDLRSGLIKDRMQRWFRYREAQVDPGGVEEILVHDRNKAPRKMHRSRLKGLARYTQVMPGDLIVTPLVRVNDIPSVTIAEESACPQVAEPGLLVLWSDASLAPELARIIFRLPEVRARLLGIASGDSRLLMVPLAIPELLERQKRMASHLTIVLTEALAVAQEAEMLAAESDRLRQALLLETFRPGRWQMKSLSVFATVGEAKRQMILRRDGPVGLDDNAIYTHKKGDILVDVSGSVSQAEGMGRAPSHVMPVLVTDNKIVTPDFLFWALRAVRETDDLPAEPENLLQLRLPIPKIAEQESVVRYLTEVVGDAEQLAREHKEMALRLRALHDEVVKAALSWEE